MADRNELDGPEAVEGEETPETLAAIRRGIADADAGRVTPIEEVREILRGWIVDLPDRGKDAEAP